MRVLVAVDGSEFATQALYFYIDHLRKPNDELYVVHAVEFPYMPAQSMYYMTDPIEPAPAAAPISGQDNVKRLLQKAKDEADAVDLKYKKILDGRQIPYAQVTHFARPAEFIVKEANEKEAGLVILGCRGMGKVRRTLIGSVSDYVMHHCHCPVLVSRH